MLLVFVESCDCAVTLLTFVTVDPDLPDEASSPGSDEVSDLLTPCQEEDAVLILSWPSHGIINNELLFTI